MWLRARYDYRQVVALDVGLTGVPVQVNRWETGSFMATSPCLLLSVQWSETDQRLLRMALANFSPSMPIELVTVSEPDQALALLRDNPQVLLRLIVMGWRFAREDDGLRLLRKLKSEPVWQAVPVIVLTCGLRTEDVERIYAEQAACVVEQPNDWDEFEVLIHMVCQLWLRS